MIHCSPPSATRRLKMTCLIERSEGMTLSLAPAKTTCGPAVNWPVGATGLSRVRSSAYAGGAVRGRHQ